jgi:hypothetical protein
MADVVNHLHGPVGISSFLPNPWHKWRFSNDSAKNKDKTRLAPKAAMHLLPYSIGLLIGWCYASGQTALLCPRFRPAGVRRATFPGQK